MNFIKLIKQMRRTIPKKYRENRRIGDFEKESGASLGQLGINKMSTKKYQAETQLQDETCETEGMLKREHLEKTCKKIREVRIEGFMEPNPTLRPCDIKLAVTEGQSCHIKLFFGRPDVNWVVYAYGSCMDEHAYFPPIDDQNWAFVNVRVDEKGKSSKDGFELYGNETYHLRLCLEAQSGYVFADDVILIVNGEKVQTGLEPVWKPPRTMYYYGGFQWHRDPEDYTLFWISWTTPHVCRICY